MDLARGIALSSNGPHLKLEWIMLRASIAMSVVLSVIAAAPSKGRAQSTDSVSVEQTVAAAMAGRYEVRETVRRAAEGCGAGPASWQRQVAERLVARPTDSIPGHVLAVVVPPMSIGMRRCEGLDVTGWIRSALDKDMLPHSYRELVRGLSADFGYEVLRRLAADPEADPLHRLWVTEALVGTNSTRRRRQLVGPGGITDRIAGHYRFNGLAPEYARTWLPMLLAAPQTRESAARDLMQAVARSPAEMGAAEILFIVATDVEAYDYRFSGETRAVVSNLLQDMEAARGDLPPGVGAALDSATAARAASRNHSGVRVQWSPLQLELAPTPSGCVVVGPPRVAQAVRAVDPDFRMSADTDCRVDSLAHGDFDGDGVEDGLLRGVMADRTVLLAVLTGSQSSAHVVTGAGGNDRGAIQTPGTFEPACDSPGPFVFQNDWIMVSYDEKYTANFRFTGSEFERLMGDEC